MTQNTITNIPCLLPPPLPNLRVAHFVIMHFCVQHNKIEKALLRCFYYIRKQDMQHFNSFKIQGYIAILTTDAPTNLYKLVHIIDTGNCHYSMASLQDCVRAITQCRHRTSLLLNVTFCIKIKIRVCMMVMYTLQSSNV